MKKILCLLLVLSCVAGLLTSCDMVASIAGNVLEAAKEELVTQVESTVEKYKVSIKEVKPLVGKLNDEGGKYQFFCALLVQTNTESNAKECANALGKAFTEAGCAPQTQSNLENKHLVHKSIAYSTSDFSEGNYYTVYVYTADLSKLVDLNALAEKLKEATT